MNTKKNINININIDSHEAINIDSLKTNNINKNEKRFKNDNAANVPLVDLIILFRNTGNLNSAQKYIIKGFPTVDQYGNSNYEGLETEIAIKSSDPLFSLSDLNSLIQNYLNTNSIYPEETIFHSGNVPLTDHYFLDINTKKFVNGQAVDSNERLKYEISLPMTDEEFREKSYRFVINDKETTPNWNDIEDMNFSSNVPSSHGNPVEKYNLRKFLKYNNIIAVNLISLSPPAELKLSSQVCVMDHLPDINSMITTDGELAPFSSLKTDSYKLYSSITGLQDFLNKSNVETGNLQAIIKEIESKKGVYIFGKLTSEDHGISVGMGIYDYKSNSLKKYFFASPYLFGQMFRDNFPLYTLDSFKTATNQNFYFTPMTSTLVEIEFLSSSNKAFQILFDKDDSEALNYINENKVRKLETLDSSKEYFLERGKFFVQKSETTASFKTEYQVSFDQGNNTAKSYIFLVKNDADKIALNNIVVAYRTNNKNATIEGLEKEIAAKVSYIWKK